MPFELLAKHAILFEQVVDDFLLAAVDPAGHREDEHLQDEVVPGGTYRFAEGPV